MATIYAPTCSVARCSKCGVQLQFHTASAVPHSADRDHDFIAETADDYDPGDLTPVQLVDAIDGAERRRDRLTDRDDQMTDEEWDAANLFDKRADACRKELKARVRTVFGVDWDDLMGSIEG